MAFVIVENVSWEVFADFTFTIRLYYGKRLLESPKDSLCREMSQQFDFTYFFSPVILIQVLNEEHHKNYKQSMLFRNFVMLAFFCLVKKKSTMTSDAYKSIYLLVFIFKNRVNHLVQNNQSTNFQFSLWCGFSGVCIFVIHSARSDCTTDILN